ncbi:hypothetical protein Tco_0227567, partial [Tanacetum coccineum]
IIASCYDISMTGDNGSPTKYTKIIIEQQITDHRGFIARMRDEIRPQRKLISHLNALKRKLEASVIIGFIADAKERFMLSFECEIPYVSSEVAVDVAIGIITTSKRFMILCCKVKSAAAKMARSKSVYQYTMRRGGYTLVKEKMDKIKEGTLKVDHGIDAMTVVLGKENGGYARGVGSGVTYKRYFDLTRSRQASDERILLLQSQLDNERCERQEKELLIQNLSNKMSQTEGMVTKLKN